MTSAITEYKPDTFVTCPACHGRRVYKLGGELVRCECCRETGKVASRRVCTCGEFKSVCGCVQRREIERLRQRYERGAK